MRMKIIDILKKLLSGKERANLPFYLEKIELEIDEYAKAFQSLSSIPHADRFPLINYKIRKVYRENISYQLKILKEILDTGALYARSRETLKIVHKITDLQKEIEKSTYNAGQSLSSLKKDDQMNQAIQTYIFNFYTMADQLYSVGNSKKNQTLEKTEASIKKIQDYKTWLKEYIKYLLDNASCKGCKAFINNVLTEYIHQYKIPIIKSNGKKIKKRRKEKKNES
jgi:hypothetical protein